ncbi:MAG TPA: glycine cleavage T C-terminal barrel domain-containing protein [Anaerolineae bacterium]|nr:glycine cleavage T C-terminal barrel domain-containing protein [Anaerolineae bacterium]
MPTKLAPTIETEYAAAKNGCVLIDSSSRGRLRISGSTRLDFLHRMSTNDLLKLQIGQGAATIFATPIARIIDRTMVYVRENDLIMLTSRDAQAPVMSWLKKYIFFNDDVQIVDATQELGMLSVYGPRAPETFQRVVGIDVSSLGLHHWRSANLGEVEVLIARADSLGTNGFHLIVQADKLSGLRSKLIDANATPIAEETYQVLRVEAGQPEYGRELTDEIIPLEANLWPDVSFTKGCYTGQEIIARMESRQRLAKQLIGLRLESEINLPARIFADDGDVGSITSIAHSPDRGWLALGYIKAALAIDDQAVQARAGDRSIAAQVVVLPFKF